MSDFFYKKNQNFLFFFYNNKRVVEIYHQKFLVLLSIMPKNYKNQPQRDGIHFSC
nr:MAG TPA: hypothetical protein [Caudoviricetes sp.]